MRRSKKVLSPARTTAQVLLERRHTSQNTGNLVHLEAMPKLLRYKEAVVRSHPAEAGDDADSGDESSTSNFDEYRKRIDRSFDGIVLQYANTIRDSIDPQEREQRITVFRNATRWLRTTTCKIYAFGMGIQDKLEPRADAVPPELFELLTVLNERAELFAVRGKETEAWLHSVGLKKAVALGCPSLFVYPMNTSRITAPSINQQTRVATAGRMQRGGGLDRLRAISKIGRTFPAYYVFQSDFFSLFQSRKDLPVYDDATGRVNAEHARTFAKKRVDLDLEFERYYLFRTVEKWRGFTEAADVFFGDRFHGGVVFLQCGRPAVLMRHDERVGELVDFFGIPNVRTKELLDGNPLDVLRSALSEENMERFRTTYLRRAADFRNAVKRAGLELANDDAFAEALGHSEGPQDENERALRDRGHKRSARVA